MATCELCGRPKATKYLPGGMLYTDGGECCGGIHCARYLPNCDGSRRVCCEPAWRPVPPVLSAREAARRRMPLDGADSQALEHALTMTERERDAALARAEQAERERDRLCGLVEAIRLACRHMRRSANLDALEEIEDALEEIEDALEEIEDALEEIDDALEEA